MSKNMCLVCFVDLKVESESYLIAVENQTYSQVFLDHLISDQELLQIPEGYELEDGEIYESNERKNKEAATNFIAKYNI